MIKLRGKVKVKEDFNRVNFNVNHLFKLSLVFVLSSIFYSFSMRSALWGQSGTPYYVHLADSLLAGRLYLNSELGFSFDLISYNGKLYVPGGILPAILLTPFVAIWKTNISDIGLGILLGSINVTLMFSLLDQIGSQGRKVSSNIWLTALFAAGTVHWWVSSIGGFLLLAQIVTVTFMLLYVKETLRDSRPGLTGLWLGLAVLSRPVTIFSFIFTICINILKLRICDQY